MRMLLCAFLASAGALVAGPTAQNFESDSPPAGWAASAGGELAVTTARFKSGERSLLWSWREPGSVLTAALPAGAAPGVAGRSLAFWLYNEEPMEQILRLELLRGETAVGCPGMCRGDVTARQPVPCVDRPCVNPENPGLQDAQLAPYGGKPVVAYLSAYAPTYLNNSNTADFVFSNITHLIYIGALSVNTNASLAISDAGNLSNVVAITHAHGARILASLTDGDGSTDSNGKLVALCASPVGRATVISNLLCYCRQYRLDGIDIDWEFPPASSLPHYRSLFQELRAAAPPGFVIATALMTGYAELADAPVDWFYLMAYTFNLSQCQSMVKSWTQHGTPPSRLVLGLGLYGANSTGKALGYAELTGTNTMDPGIDSCQGYKFTGPDTVRQLTQYVYRNGLGGIGWFRIELDTCDRRSLMRAGAMEARALTR
jgi:hypothetical protein